MSTESGKRLAHSAIVHMQLVVDGRTLTIGHMGADYVIADDPINHPPAKAEMVMSVNAEVTRWRVYLPDGISTSADCIRLRACHSVAVPWGRGVPLRACPAVRVGVPASAGFLAAQRLPPLACASVLGATAGLSSSACWSPGFSRFPGCPTAATAGLRASVLGATAGLSSSACWSPGFSRFPGCPTAATAGLRAVS